MKQRLAVAWPGPAVKSILDKDPDVAFLDHQGWWIYSEGSECRTLVALTYNPSAVPSHVSIPEIRNKLNWWSPIWTRWMGLAENYELDRAKSVLLVLQIITGLRNFEINAVIFHTGVPHHYDSSLVSIACETYGIDQHFLYANVFDNDLIPLKQSGNIFTRKPLGAKIRSYEYTSLIDSFIKNKYDNDLPKTNTSLNIWKMSSHAARLYVIYSKAKTETYKLLQCRNKSQKDRSWILKNSYPAGALMRIIDNQQEFIKAYESSCIVASTIVNYTKAGCIRLLIAAHYQPEATSFPEGGTAFNHVDIALTLRSKGYRDELLYKEHPASWLYLDNVIGLTRVGLWRSADYVNDLEGLGCLFLPKNYQLSIVADQSNWFVPVTITGTIAIERSLVGLHTIVTGEPWFKGLPGTLALKEIESLETINKKWVEPDLEIAKAARNFLSNILTDRTLINVPGIGTGRLFSDSIRLKDFENQLLKLKSLL